MADSIFATTAGTVQVDDGLSGDGSPASPLDVLVDGVSVVLNGSNQLEAAGVTGVLSTAHGGTSVDIASEALPLGSGQITFPATQNPSTNVHILDDYEEGAEGSWTPTDASGAGLTFTVDACTYIKIGRFVMASFHITWPATVNGTDARVGGLPFTCENGTNTIYGSAFSLCTESTAFGALVVKNTTQFLIQQQVGTGVANSAMSGDQIRGSVFYLATA